MLIDKFIPTYHYNEIHKRLIDGSAKECFLATKNLDISPSFITRLLLRLRGLPYKAASFGEFIKGMCFTYLEENLYQEFVIDASKANLKIYWNFSCRWFHPEKPVLPQKQGFTVPPEKRNRNFLFIGFGLSLLAVL